MNLFEEFKMNMEKMSAEELDQFWKKFNAHKCEGPSAQELISQWEHQLSVRYNQDVIESAPPPHKEYKPQKKALRNQGLFCIVCPAWAITIGLKSRTRHGSWKC